MRRSSRVQPARRPGRRSSRPRTTGSRSGSASSTMTAASASSRRVHHSAADLTALALSADGALAAFSSAHRSTGLEYSVLTARHCAWRSGPGALGRARHEHRRPLVRPGRRRPPPRSRPPTRRAASGPSSGTWTRAIAAISRPMRPPATSSASTGHPTAARSCSAGSTRPSSGCWSGTSSSDAVRVLEHPAGAVIGYMRVRRLLLPARRRARSCAAGRTSASRARLIGLDPATGRQTRTILASGEVPPGRALRSVSFPTTDGTTQLQAWLGRARRRAAVPGDPRDARRPDRRDRSANFHPQAQAFLDEGFAVLSLNYRGLDDVRARVRAGDLGPAGRARDPGPGGARTVADRDRASRSRTGSCSRAGRTAAT